MVTQWNVWYFRQVVTDFEAGIYKQEKNLLSGGKICRVSWFLVNTKWEQIKYITMMNFICRMLMNFYLYAEILKPRLNINP